MIIDSLTLYKLMTLYMLNKVNFPLTNTQISGFFLDKEYTTYFVFQQVVSELLESKFITAETVRNTSYYRITDLGIETIELFNDKIPVDIIDDMDIFLIENKYEMRNEVGTTSDYYKSTNQDYIVNCQIKEGNSSLIELNLSVPSEDVAEIMCNNWKDASQEIYSMIMKRLMKDNKK
jgi:DNA-binding PadR family transcriptional regulator